MILVGLGSNLAGPGYPTPLATAQAALLQLPTIGAPVMAASPWYLSAPVPVSEQPWFANAVAVVASDLPPDQLLDRLLDLERRFGRARSVADAPRTLDLDLLDHDGVVCCSPHLVLPHPRLHQRRFVLEPLRDVAAEWCHPTLGLTAAQLLARLPPGQELRRLDP